MPSFRRALSLGIGGGGDVVGALVPARICEALGGEALLGGVTWERLAIDPKPGPRRLEEIEGGRRIGGSALLADATTRTTDGLRFAESGMAQHTGEQTLLIDVGGGAEGVAEGIEAALEQLGCDLLVLVDVGGDAIAAGEEPGLSSPLCDAVMLAGGVAAARSAGASVALAIVGPGCDGELEPGEVMERTAALAGAGAWLGAWGVTLPLAGEIEAAAELIPTEASLQVARCARGASGPTKIRGGRRTVQLGPLGAIVPLFEAAAALEACPLAAAVRGTANLEDARRLLYDRGVRTELDYELDRAPG